MIGRSVLFPGLARGLARDDTIVDLTISVIPAEAKRRAGTQSSRTGLELQRELVGGEAEDHRQKNTQQPIRHDAGQARADGDAGNGA